MKFQPYLVGSGNAAGAIAKCLAMLPLVETKLEVFPLKQIARGEALPKVAVRDGVHPVLLLANPHGLHARYLIEGEAAGFALMFSEKPAAVTKEDVAKLARLKARVAVFHGYRVMWGPQALKALIPSLGEIVALEGRYWQSSATKRTGKASWKNDVALNGPHDVLVDLGAHWVDLAHFLIGKTEGASAWLAFPNSEAGHRDTHVQLTLELPGGRRGFVSLSKAFHGKGNFLEMNVLGTDGAATWNFERPDEIVIGRGRETQVVRRTDNDRGAKLPPFHGMGWLDGYFEILKRALLDEPGYPTLEEHLPVMRTLLDAARFNSR